MKGARPPGKPVGGIAAGTRRQLLVLARRKGARTTSFRPGRPTNWRPHSVRNPNGAFEERFTDFTAWEFIASRLEAGEAVKEVVLQKPKGKKGYVMKIDLGVGLRTLYVKLQLGSGIIIGRSFHYSKHG